MYVVGDEQDLVKLRTNYRKDPVYMYPIKTQKEKIQNLFLDIMNRVNKLNQEPEFYNTITSTCTTAILDHVNKLRDENIHYSWKIFFPGYSDEIVYENNYMDTNLSFEEAKKHFLINKKAEKFANSGDFSIKIREN